MPRAALLALLSSLVGVPGCSPSPSPAPSPPGDEPAPSGPPLRRAIEAPPEPTTAAAPLSRADLEAIVAADDREADDRKTDARRKPVELLLFAGIAPGMKVADIGAGFGYTTELLARAVGPTGTVYGQNPKFVLERFAEAGWSARLAKPIMANTVRLDREFDDPFPPQVGDLDIVFNVLFYHDFEWQGVDRAAHNQAVIDALRPGGLYIVVDHRAASGAGASGSKTLHRIERDLVVAEITAAGLELIEEGDFLRNPNDTLDWNALPWRSDREELSDRFVLKFRKLDGPPF